MTEQPTIPAKVEAILRVARRHGLTIVEIPSQQTEWRHWECYVGQGNERYSLSRTNEVWLWWAAGRNGGRLVIKLYRRRPTRRQSHTIALTRREAASWMQTISPVDEARRHADDFSYLASMIRRGLLPPGLVDRIASAIAGLASSPSYLRLSVQDSIKTWTETA